MLRSYRSRRRSGSLPPVLVCPQPFESPLQLVVLSPSLASPFTHHLPCTINVCSAELVILLLQPDGRPEHPSCDHTPYDESQHTKVWRPRTLVCSSELPYVWIPTVQQLEHLSKLPWSPSLEVRVCVDRACEQPPPPLLSNVLQPLGHVAVWHCT